MNAFHRQTNVSGVAGRVEWRRFRVNRPGASAVELAVGLPLLVLLALGCVDFGQAMHLHIAISNAAGVGAEYGSTRNCTPHTQAAWEENIRQAVEEELNDLGLWGHVRDYLPEDWREQFFHA